MSREMEIADADCAVLFGTSCSVTAGVTLVVLAFREQFPGLTHLKSCHAWFTAVFMLVILCVSVFALFRGLYRKRKLMTESPCKDVHVVHLADNTYLARDGTNKSSYTWIDTTCDGKFVNPQALTTSSSSPTSHLV